MQVDPVIPTLKAPGSKHVKLEYDALLPNVAFNFNLRRYIKAGVDAAEVAAMTGTDEEHAAATRMQTMQRGAAARWRVTAVRAERAAAAREQEDLNAAALQVQSAQRGKSAGACTRPPFSST